MKKPALRRFFMCYILFAVPSFLLLCFFIPKGMYNYLLTDKAHRLVLSATQMSEYGTLSGFQAQNPPASLITRELLDTVANSHDADYFLVAEDCEILVHSNHTYPVPDSEQLLNYPLRSDTGIYWETGDQLQPLCSDSLNIIAPLPSSFGTVNYMIIAYPLDHIRNDVSLLFRQVFLVLLIVYIASLLIPYCYYTFYYKPLKQITELAVSYASGILASPPNLQEKDDLFALRASLDTLADRIRSSTEDQRRLISDISHDFRSPLTSIIGYTQALKDGLIPDEERERILNLILQEAKRLSEMTRKNLTLNMLQEEGSRLNLTTFDLNKVIVQVMSTLEYLWSKEKITVSFYPDRGHYPVLADEEQIKQVLFNLIDNAIKFCNSGDHIIIHTYHNRSTVFTSIQDTGIGISATELPKIWNRFYKSDQSRGKDRSGTGLGLAIVREIIQSHGQTIDVTSTKGSGTEFVFTLERAKLL